MLRACFRSLAITTRTPIYRPLLRNMSSEAAPKRAHSASPPPSIAPPVPSTSSATSPAAKRVKLDTGAEEAAPAAAEPAVAPTAPAAGADVKAAGQQKRNEANKNRNANKKGGKKHKGKPPKPGGVEEAGAFDVLELLGEARVKELEALERDWKKESEVEWGAGADGKEVEVRVVAMNAHGMYQLEREQHDRASQG